MTPVGKEKFQAEPLPVVYHREISALAPASTAVRAAAVRTAATTAPATSASATTSAVRWS